jgi:hypothetical protein
MARFGLAFVAAAAALGLGSAAALAAATSPSTARDTTARDTTRLSGTLKSVTYLGYTFSVPASWPVIHTTRASATCVRFDRHAIYLGDPGQNQSCPSGLLGTTEAMLVQAAPGQAASAAEDATARRITVLSPGIEVTATYDTHRALVTQILASASLPLPATSPGSTAPTSMAPASTGPGPTANAAQMQMTPTAGAAVPAGATSYTGQGFDACTAPSSAYMTAWKSASPYGAVGVYVGGADRACAQANLTASWVSQQAAAGWHFLPTYVGVQAAFGQITSPASQGLAAAQDAVTQAAALGFGPGTPLYYDMETYPSGQQSNALSFLSAWTTQLHVEGYRSGVYSSSSSGITDLAGNLTRYAMPDVIWDALWNGNATTADSAIPTADWATHQRVHQYNGGVNATYGGDALNIDQDYLDVAVTPLPADPAQPALVTRSGTISDFVIRGDRNLYAYAQGSPGGSFPSPQKLTATGNLTGSPAAVLGANGAISVYARTTAGSVKAIWQAAAGGSFSNSASLGGSITGSPAAIITHNGTVALYATGTNGQLYTWTQATPGGPFSAPTRLTANGGLTGTPVAVQTSNGVISVFDRGSTGVIRAKWQSAPGGSFSNSANLGGTITGGPAAIITHNGTVALYATGTNGQLYTWTQATPGGPFSSPTRLTVNGGLTGTPVAALNGSGVVSVFDRTTSGSVRAKWQSAPGGAFTGSANLGGSIAGGMAALAVGNDTVSLYATGTDGRQYGDRQVSPGGAYSGWAVI